MDGEISIKLKEGAIPHVEAMQELQCRNCNAGTAEDGIRQTL